MSEALMTEREFRDELRRKYRAEGFEELDTRAIAGALSADYEPDLAFRQGDSVYVIEVKTPGQATSADQIRRLREIVERRPNWSFRFMVVPRRPAAPEDIDAVDLVPSALRLADDVRQIAPPIALVALWIALETSLRRLLTLRQERPPFGTSSMTMARRLRDLEELTDEDVQVIESGYRARSRAVHGYHVDDQDIDFLSLDSLVADLCHRAGISLSGAESADTAPGS